MAAIKNRRGKMRQRGNIDYKGNFLGATQELPEESVERGRAETEEEEVRGLSQDPAFSSCEILPFGQMLTQESSQ
uniref:Uncharacterized protein n=1 Tax=Knipowitschia caucasica TaxID=637954 RepID=A0AAV2MT14_KNICA